MTDTAPVAPEPEVAPLPPEGFVEEPAPQPVAEVVPVVEAPAPEPVPEPVEAGPVVDPYGFKEGEPGFVYTAEPQGGPPNPDEEIRKLQ